MTTLWVSRAAQMLAMCSIGALAFAGTDVPPAAGQALSSTKERGVVSVAPEPALSQGRLILKVVAFNRMREPAAFSASDVQILTAAGKPVGLVPLERLIDEAVKARGGRHAVASNADHNPSDYSHPSIPNNGTGGAGEPELGGYTGTVNPTSGVLSAHTSISTDRSPKDAATQAQIESLRAGILQSTLITAAKAAGGQVVSEKLKFARKESRTLRVLVDFNGEQHEFSIEAPVD